MSGKKGNKKHANKTSFAPGVSGNPGGRAQLPPEIREARKLNQIELEKTINRYLFAPLNELARVILDPETPAIDALVCSLLSKAVEIGDPTRFELILCRLIGKVTEKVEVELPKPFVITRMDGTQVVAGVERVKREGES